MEEELRSSNTGIATPRVRVSEKPSMRDGARRGGRGRMTSSAHSKKDRVILVFANKIFSTSTCEPTDS